MPSCISVFTNVDFTAVALSAPQDGFSIAVAMATPTPTPGPTSGPTATPAPSPSDTPLPSATPAATPNPTPSDTPAPSASPAATPLPTPSPTSAALCISVDGSTNGFGTAQLSSPDNGFSFANNNIANPTPTPSPTPASGLPAAAASCGTASSASWPAYGASNSYTITLPDNLTQLWYNVTNPSTRTVYMFPVTGGGTSNWFVSDDSDILGGDPPCLLVNQYKVTAFTYANGKAFIINNQTGNFAIQGFNGTFPQDWTIYIV